MERFGRIFSFVLFSFLVYSSCTWAQSQSAPDAEKLLKNGQLLSDKTNYLEALDLLDKARDILEASGADNSALFADVLFASAQTKIRARLHQDFPADYVKMALQEVQTANRLRETLTGVLPQKMSEGYFLEGYIHKRFFMRYSVARICFERALKFDSGNAAVKRELSELQVSDDQK
ncbi:hypothetical protein [Desulfomonile tiedjei]|uniref:Tetratricopeptide repeat protein n=1 Tax=Desulfomonile tiedjei (strain ATCC 49306 / DSM 6799 / DCB-1) TaxID=706587 RepID=I4C3R0_DESTA|nr:hypothetical protein [Desulfomonile tiedjei]AFM24201.1 hypothetical protein Desti_1489 [Desulfomonile tiedjei DSM 6799]